MTGITAIAIDNGGKQTRRRDPDNAKDHAPKGLLGPSHPNIINTPVPTSQNIPIRSAPGLRAVSNVLGVVAATIILVWSYHQSYLLFHTLAELFSIVVAGSIFAIAWNSRRFHEDSSLVYLGVAFLAVAATDFIHAMAYRGMGVFPQYDANLPTQLWIAGRYVMAISFLGFPFTLGRHIRASAMLVVAGAVVAAILVSIFEFSVFPDCFVEGKGLTPFKRWSEYIICGMLFAAIGGTLWRANRVGRRVLILLVATMFVTILQELCFTLYLDPYGHWNMVGHLLKVLAFFLVYKGIVETGLSRPYDLLFYDLKKHERALAASEAQYRQLVGNLHTAVVVHGPDTRILLSNPRASELLGLSADQLAGRAAIDPAWSFVREDGTPLPIEDYPVNSVIASRKPLIHQVVGVNRPSPAGAAPTANGTSRVWVLVNAFPSVDARGELEQVVVTFVDVTAQREADAVIRQSEATLRQFMDSSPVLMGLAELAEDGNDVIHVYGNPETCRFYGGGSVAGRWLSDLEVPRERIREIAARVLQSDAEQRPVRFECLMRPAGRSEADGRLVEWVVSGTAKGPSGRTRFCFVGQDITDRKAIELSLQAAKASAEEASRAKDHFISSLSHELRTPLTPVLAAVGVWRGEAKLPADMRDDLEMIERNIGLEVALISDLLDVTRITSGKLSLSREPIDLAGVVRHAARICFGESVTVSLDLDLKGAPYIVLGDSARLHQVFWNLIKNAIKFSPPHGRISIVGEITDCDVRVCVTDCGIGIPAASLPRIFSPFEQGERGARYGGLGLGLAIARGIIEAHGGHLSAHSEGENRGATFCVHLPLTQATAKTRETVPADAKASFETHAMRILLVEDHADTVRAVVRLLQRQGHDVVAATTAEEALEFAKSQDFDVIVSDLGLPDRTGIELLRTLRESGSKVPAIAMSGYGQASDIDNSVAAGFCAHLVKPVDMTQLLAAIRAAGSGTRQT